MKRPKKDWVNKPPQPHPLKKAIREYGYSQTAVIKAIGGSYTTFNAALNGSESLSPKRALEVCKFLGIEDPRPYCLYKVKKKRKKKDA